LQLVIKDNGRGINLEKHKNDIFGLHKTFHGNSDAKGIGLFITKLQVEALNGRIELESKENRGTSFIVHFPIHNN
jgi:signal transduction histidine kinase